MATQQSIPQSIEQSKIAVVSFFSQVIFTQLQKAAVLPHQGRTAESDWISG